MSSFTNVIKFSELDSMHTGSLMSRRTALLKCEYSLEGSDEDDDYEVPPDTIRFKNSDEWKLAFSQLKQVLSTRENWKSGRDRKEDRELKAKYSKSSRNKDR